MMSFQKEKHIRYWRMCARSLPDHYLSNDGSRMTLGFFIVSALDLLGVLGTVDPKERQSWIAWIYSCQLSEGGFRGFTGTDLNRFRSDSNRHWDPANIPATFFALATLLILGDDLSKVRRQDCLGWLPRLQREDGSFGEVLSEDGTIEGDRDLRQCCCAAGIAYILQDSERPQPALNEEKLIRYIQSCQDRSGGFGVSPFREPHSGLSYCAIAALSFVQKCYGKAVSRVFDQIPAIDQCLKWLLERQTNYLDEEVEDDEEDDDDDDDEDGQADRACPSNIKGANANLLSVLQGVQAAGFNGRENKIADTCYVFWNTGALAILEKEHLVDAEAMEQYLLAVTQHQIGGFGKGRGDPPDVLHSYLGLAALALFGHSEVQALDPTMCMSLTSAARLARVSWKKDQRGRT